MAERKEHWTDRVYPQPKAATVALEEVDTGELCPNCKEPMQCYGNLENKVIPMNPPMEDATWACHECRIKRKVRRPVNYEHDPTRIKFYETMA